MGMSIEEIIRSLIAMKSVIGVNQLTINEAIETMRKYQKIQEIINNAKDSDGAVKYNWLYEQISGVMEDGTD